MMPATLIARYQSGGDIYNTLAAQYGTANADAVASAATSGDETQVNAALTQAKFGNPLDTSTADAFMHQITTDPFAAPASAFNDQIKKLLANIFGNPFLLIGIVVVGFFFFGGASLLRSKIGGAK